MRREEKEKYYNTYFSRERQEDGRIVKGRRSNEDGREVEGMRDYYNVVFLRSKTRQPKWLILLEFQRENLHVWRTFYAILYFSLFLFFSLSSIGCSEFNSSMVEHLIYLLYVCEQ